MIRQAQIIILLLVSQYTLGQSPFILDSLFKMDCSAIKATRLAEQHAEIDRLNRDWGVSAGVGVSNSFQDEIGAGLSARVFVKGDVWKGAYTNRHLDAQVINKQITIDNILGVDRAQAHNYHFYYDYIITLFNTKRIEQINRILLDNEQFYDQLKDLYYDKVIDYSDLQDLQNNTNQYHLLRSSLLEFNQLFDHDKGDLQLPTLENHDHWSIDFATLLDQINQDTTHKAVIELQQAVLELNYRKEKAPSLSTTIGYDLARQRPFFAMNFSIDIQRPREHHLAAQKSRVANDMHLREQQKTKAVLHVQYEYRYKEKQLTSLYASVEALQEQQRQLHVRSTVLSISAAIQEKKIAIEIEKVKYEIIDLKGQMMLLLLQLKRALPSVELAPYIKDATTKGQHRKFAGQRFLVISKWNDYTTIDTLLLQQNEIIAITPQQLENITDIVEVDPGLFATRGDMERQILSYMEEDGTQKFLIKNLESLRDLELATIAHRALASAPTLHNDITD